MPITKDIITNPKSKLNKTYKTILKLKETQNRETKRIPNSLKKKPGVFIGNSFLHVKTHTHDEGIRPIEFTKDIRDICYAGCTHPVHSTDISQEFLGAVMIGPVGETRKISCTVRNSGDLDAPCVTIELRIFDFTNFDWQNNAGIVSIKDSKVIGLESISLQAFSSAVINFNYVVEQSDIGRYYCLSSRLYSVSLNDVPYDWNTINPLEDRHNALHLAYFHYHGGNQNWEPIPRP